MNPADPDGQAGERRDVEVCGEPRSTRAEARREIVLEARGFGLSRETWKAGHLVKLLRPWS